MATCLISVLHDFLAIVKRLTNTKKGASDFEAPDSLTELHLNLQDAQTFSRLDGRNQPKADVREHTQQRRVLSEKISYSFLVCDCLVLNWLEDNNFFSISNIVI
jgi:hypothetical protein